MTNRILEAPTQAEIEAVGKLTNALSDVLFEHSSTERGCLISVSVLATLAGQASAAAAAHISIRTNLASTDEIIMEILDAAGEAAANGARKIIATAKA